MKWEANRSTLQSIIHNGTIIFLIVLLLFVGSLSVNYMLKSAAADARYEHVRSEAELAAGRLESKLVLEAQRKIAPLSSRVDTLERRVKELERELYKLDLKQQE